MSGLATVVTAGALVGSSLGATPNTVVAQRVRLVAVATPTVPVSPPRTPDSLRRIVDLDLDRDFGRLTVRSLDRTTTDVGHTSDVCLRVTGAEPPGPAPVKPLPCRDMPVELST